MKPIGTDPSIEDLRAVRDYIGRDSDYYAADLVDPSGRGAELAAEKIAGEMA